MVLGYYVILVITNATYFDSIPWLIKDDFDTITRYLVLARDPIMPRANKPFKVRDIFTIKILFHIFAK
jgi:hypothetical protein